MATPLVSVIVPAYNCAEFVAQSLDSVIAQTFKDWEMIVVGDGSTDETFSVCERIARRDTRIRLLRQPNSGSASAPRNRAFKESAAQYVAFLDPDDFWKPTKLSRQVEVMQRYPNINLLFGDPELVDKNGRFIDSALGRLGLLTEAAPHLEELENGLFLCRPSYYSYASCRYTGIQTSGVMLRRSATRKLTELFPTDLRVYEDNDLWWRLMLGGRIALVNERLHSYRQHESSVMQDMDKVVPDRLEAHIRNYRRGQAFLPPEWRARYRLRISNEYFYLGWQLKNKGLVGQARAAYINSLRWQWRIRPALAWMKTFVARRRQI